MVLTQDYYLILDRTNWKWVKNINVLVLAVAYGLAIPVRWVLLDKRGNSNTQERIDIWPDFIKQFGKNSNLGIADREFIGEKWFKNLKIMGINFNIRIKTMLTTNSQG
ncbi:MAG: hypothetical protein IPL59_16300 [Candidatus Competibacteraceae bacterium]|nr:hypothetical protein [Candidatus Competibacteraceae bacterium]